jgi:hypothetical protein
MPKARKTAKKKPAAKSKPKSKAKKRPARKPSGNLPTKTVGDLVAGVVDRLGGSTAIYEASGKLSNSLLVAQFNHAPFVVDLTTGKISEVPAKLPDSGPTANDVAETQDDRPAGDNAAA